MMNFAHLIIDVDERTLDPKQQRGWPRLLKSISVLKDGLTAHSVPTINMAFLYSRFGEYWPPMVGSFAEVSAELVRHGVRDSRTGRFYDGNKQNDFFALKMGCSAATAPILKLLDRLKIECVILSGVYECYQEEQAAWQGSCVTASAVHFAAEGLRSIIASEATNVMHLPSWLNPPTGREAFCQKRGVELLPTQEIIRLVKPARQKQRFDPSAVV